jgi:hypothetical protein
MRKELVDAPTLEQAEKLCPWAAKIVEVDSGDREVTTWLCFESWSDYEVWESQN